MLTYKNVCQFVCTEHEVPDNSAVQRLLLDLCEICGPSIYGVFKDACSLCKLCYELDSKMIMNGKYDLERVGHRLCEGAALPFWMV